MNKKKTSPLCYVLVKPNRLRMLKADGATAPDHYNSGLNFKSKMCTSMLHFPLAVFSETAHTILGIDLCFKKATP